MSHIVDEQIAIDFDVETSLFLGHIAHWIKMNFATNKNFHHGRYWTYNSYDEYSKYFQYWTPKQVRRIVGNCIKFGLLLKDNFNEKTYDNTGWYTLTDKALEYFPLLRNLLQNQPEQLPKRSDTSAQMGRAIPDNKPNNNINIISDIVEIYHEELPELPKVKKVDGKLRGQLSKMIKDWPNYQKEGKKFSVDLFRDYLKFLKTYHSWLLKPYKTDSGNVVKSSLRKITREITLTKIVNGEYSAS